MKNFSVIHILLFLLCMLVYKCASAQDLLVTTKGDTISGEIKILNYGNEKKVQIIQVNKKKITYSLFETRSFRHKEENYYPMKNYSGYTFMKLLKQGYLSLYAYQIEQQTSYDGLLLAKRDGAFLEVPNLGFKKQMAKFLSDCENVSSQLDEGDLAKKDLPRIIDEYNACIDKRSERISPEPMAIKPLAMTSTWDILETKPQALPDFEGKSTALEMLTEIKNKLKHQEKVPNFMLDGLKDKLANQENLTTELEKALAEIQK